MNQEKIKELEKTVINSYDNITGIVVHKTGAKAYERYFNGFTAKDSLHVFSVTKSIFSALIGIAADKGLIRSMDQRVLDFFPDYTVKAGEKTIRNITIENLLTMTAPYKFESEPYEAFFTSGNWINTALDLLGGDGPIGEFLYSPIIGAHILSGILAHAVGRPILDFATENLFAPLGIHVTHNIVFHNKEEQLAFYEIEKHTGGWAVDPQGLNTASWGLTLTPEDMAKIGQLYLNGGLWEDKQLVSEKWIKASTRAHARWGELSFGYLWWVLDEKQHSYAAMGDGGNVIYINTAKNLVVSVASLYKPDVMDRIDFIRRYIEPIFEE